MLAWYKLSQKTASIMLELERRGKASTVFVPAKPPLDELGTGPPRSRGHGRCALLLRRRAHGCAQGRLYTSRPL